MPGEAEEFRLLMPVTPTSSVSPTRQRQTPTDTILLDRLFNLMQRCYHVSSAHSYILIHLAIHLDVMAFASSTNPISNNKLRRPSDRTFQSTPNPCVSITGVLPYEYCMLFCMKICWQI
jgi:hypothetical protein